MTDVGTAEVNGMRETEKLTELDICEIKKYVSNRYPFLMIDRVIEVLPGKYARGYKNVTVNESFFQGHFPDSPLMPGMIQAEALLQMLSLTVLTIDGNAGKIVRGVSADKIRFKERVVPGSRIDIEAYLNEWDGRRGTGNVRGLVKDREVCSAEFEFVLTGDTGDLTDG